jgi:hypothetical protein
LLEAKNLSQFGLFDFGAFRVVNYYFTSLIASAIPVTIMITTTSEFSNAYALKLISNGLKRQSYFNSKLILAITLALISAILYLLVFLFLALTKKISYFDTRSFLTSTISALILSSFFSLIAVSCSLSVRSWQYSLLLYYGYFIVEGFIAYRLERNTIWVSYLPFHLAISIFQLQRSLTVLSNYLLAASILVGFCAMVTCLSYRQFKKTDL